MRRICGEYFVLCRAVVSLGRVSHGWMGRCEFVFVIRQRERRLALCYVVLCVLFVVKNSINRQDLFSNRSESVYHLCRSSAMVFYRLYEE